MTTSVKTLPVTLFLFVLYGAGFTHSASADCRVLLAVQENRILDLESFSAVSTEADRRKVEKHFRKLDLSQSISSTQAREWIAGLYRLTRIDLSATPRMLKFLQPPQHPDDRIRERIEIELVQRDFMKILQNLNFIPDSGMREKFKDWRYRNQPWHRAIIQASLASLTVPWIGIPGNLPDLQRVNITKIPSDLLENIESGGFDSAAAEIEKLLSAKARFDFRWAIARNTYNRLVSAYLLSGIISMGSLAYNLQSMASDSTQAAAAELQEKTFNPETIRSEQLESWKEAYQAFENRAPTFEDIETERKKLAAIPDGDLKAKF